jgi:hypothetical protein
LNSFRLMLLLISPFFVGFLSLVKDIIVGNPLGGKENIVESVSMPGAMAYLTDTDSVERLKHKVAHLKDEMDLPVDVRINSYPRPFAAQIFHLLSLQIGIQDNEGSPFFFQPDLLIDIFRIRHTLFCADCRYHQSRITPLR